MHRVCGSLADAETGKDASQQIVGTERTGDLAQCLLRLTQILGKQLAGAGQGQLGMPVIQVGGCLMQGFQVPAACAEATSAVC